MTPGRQTPAGKPSGVSCGEPETAGPPGSSIGLSCVVWKSRRDGQEDGRLKTSLKGRHQAGTGALDLPTDALPVGGPWWETPPCPRVGGPGPPLSRGSAPAPAPPVAARRPRSRPSVQEHSTVRFLFARGEKHMFIRGGGSPALRKNDLRPEAREGARLPRAR